MRARAALLAVLFTLGCGRVGFDAIGDGGRDGAAVRDAIGLDTGPPTAGLVGWWKLDDGTGINVKDSSPTQNDGSIGQCGMPYPTWIPGRIAGALQFSAADFNCMYADEVPELEIDGSWTVATWVNLASVPANTADYALVVKPNAFSQHNYALFADNNGYAAGLGWSVDYYDAGSVPSFVKAATGLVTGEWVHVAGTWDGTSLTIYVDGAAGGSAITGRQPYSAPFIDPNEGLLGENQCCGDYLDGALDDVRIYNRALDAAEIASLYDVP